jgi:hypothetical protein
MRAGDALTPVRPPGSGHGNRMVRDLVHLQPDGGSEPLKLDPVHGWTATLILAAALDLNRPHFGPGRGK